MTATDELRCLLDEQGVEWDYDITGAASTRFNANGVELTFIDMRDGVICSTILTPEQAIAATLGSCNCSDNCTNGERTNGTCEMEYVSDWMSWHCKSCDQMDMAPRNPKPRYCKWCGRKVVSE